MKQHWPPAHHRRAHADWGELLLGCGLLGLLFVIIVKIAEFLLWVLAQIIVGIVTAFRHLAGKRPPIDGNPTASDIAPILAGILALVTFGIVVFSVLAPTESRPGSGPSAVPAASPPVVDITPPVSAQPYAVPVQPALGGMQTTEPVGQPVPPDATAGRAPDLNAELFLSRWVKALTDGSEDSLAEVYAPKVDYEGINRRKLSSIADKQVSVHRLMPGARYDLEAFRIPDATENRYVVEADIRLSGNDPDVQRRMTRRLVLQRDGGRFVIVQEDPVPHG
jgi:hypothetical protein